MTPATPFDVACDLIRLQDPARVLDHAGLDVPPYLVRAIQDVTAVWVHVRRRDLAGCAA